MQSLRIIITETINKSVSVFSEKAEYYFERKIKKRDIVSSGKLKNGILFRAEN